MVKSGEGLRWEQKQVMVDADCFGEKYKIVEIWGFRHVPSSSHSNPPTTLPNQPLNQGELHHPSPTWVLTVHPTRLASATPATRLVFPAQ